MHSPKTALRVGAGVLCALVLFFLISLVIVPAFQKSVTQNPNPTLADAPTGERVACIDDNTEALIWRLRLIEAAREEIILATFGFGDGAAGKDILSALAQAAERGVRVRLLLDGYHGAATGRSPAFQALVTMENVQVRLYNEINLLTPWTANYRMHDKYLVVDDTAYILGGRNTNNLFLGDYSQTPNVDRDILVYTPTPGAETSLAQVRAYFESVWTLDTVRAYTCPETEQVTQARGELKKRYEALRKTWPQAFEAPDWEGSTVPAEKVMLITGQIQPVNKAPVLWDSLVELMARGEDVWIQTPYVICNRKMYQDLESLPGNVTILTNSPETGANPFGCADLKNQKDAILKTGVTLVEYAGSESLHTKTIVIDDNISIVGSFNLDMRSAYLDTETMLVIDCPALNAHLRQQMAAAEALSLKTDPTGHETPGPDYTPGTLNAGAWLLHWLLRLLTIPARHLL